MPQGSGSGAAFWTGVSAPDFEFLACGAETFASDLFSFAFFPPTKIMLCFSAFLDDLPAVETLPGGIG